MKGKSQLVFLVIGMLIYILDLTSDVWSAVRYYQNDESKWFAMTVSFIAITILISNITACLHASKDTFEGPYKCLWIFCIGCPILFRYLEELSHWKRTNLDSSLCQSACRKPSCAECKKHLEKKQKLSKSIYLLAWLHLIQASTESAPQVCLQLYIMLNQWHFSRFTVSSASVSLLSLVWCITALEQARKSKDNGGNFKRGSSFAFFAMQLFAIISRVSAIVIFSYVLECNVFWVLVFHWLGVTTAVAIHRRDEFKGEGVGPWIFMLVTSVFTVYPLLVFVSTPLLPFSKNGRFYTLAFSVVLAMENAIMFAVSVGIAKFSDTMTVGHRELLFPLAIASVLGAIVLKTVFWLVYHRCCRTKESNENENRRGTNETMNGHVSSATNNGAFNNQC